MRDCVLIAVLGGVAVLGGCEKQLQAPTDRGVCWNLVRPDKAPPKFNLLARNVPDLEHCAADLEKMRLSFETLGLARDTVDGAYQGQFLFIGTQGAFTSATEKGFRYPFLVRTGDGRLAVPGAMPQDPEQK